MTTLAVATPRTYETGIDPHDNALPIIANDIVYEGAAVGKSSGRCRPLVAADSFLGFAKRTVDNTAGAAGAKDVELIQQGVVSLAVTGVTAITDEGSTVYASDDATFTLASTGNSSIGKIIRWISSTTCLVFFQAASRRSI